MANQRRPIVNAIFGAYKVTLSPLFAVLGARCRHEPTCSEYAADCVSQHGVWAGGWMSFARLSRCRPGGSSGYDPAPEHKNNAPFWAPWRFGDWNPSQRLVPELDPDADDNENQLL